MFCLVNCYVIGATGEFSTGELSCCRTSLVFGGVATSLVCLRFKAWVNCCVVSSVVTSLVFDSLALVNYCVVVLLGRVSNQLRCRV